MTSLPPDLFANTCCPSCCLQYQGWGVLGDNTEQKTPSNPAVNPSEMPKVKKSKGGGGGEKSGAMPLADQILQADALRSRGRVKSRDTRGEAEDAYVDDRLSRKILQQARIQQEELQSEYGLAPVEKKAPVTVLGTLDMLGTGLYGEVPEDRPHPQQHACADKHPPVVKVDE